jgi:hypothetical protein
MDGPFVHDSQETAEAKKEHGSRLSLLRMYDSILINIPLTDLTVNQ